MNAHELTKHEIENLFSKNEKNIVKVRKKLHVLRTHSCL